MKQNKNCYEILILIKCYFAFIVIWISIRSSNKHEQNAFLQPINMLSAQLFTVRIFKIHCQRKEEKNIFLPSIEDIAEVWPCLLPFQNIFSWIGAFKVIKFNFHLHLYDIILKQMSFISSGRRV